MNAPAAARLIASHLYLWRGEQCVLQDLSLEAGAGECLQVTGANGAGKTTLLRALCGLIPLEAGTICWNGRAVHDDWSAFHRALAYLGHHHGFKADLSVRENLRFSAALRRRVSPSQLDAALVRVALERMHARPLRTLSAGQQRRVALARLLLAEASLWILDEPGSNLDAAGLVLLHGLLEEHLLRGGTAVVATHQALALRSPPRTLTLALA